MRLAHRKKTTSVTQQTAFRLASIHWWSTLRAKAGTLNELESELESTERDMLMTQRWVERPSQIPTEIFQKKKVTLSTGRKNEKRPLMLTNAKSCQLGSEIVTTHTS